VIFWDLFGQQGHPIRTTISEMGPLLLSRLMNADRGPGRRNQHRLQDRRRRRLPLLDLKDLQALLANYGRARGRTPKYGFISKAVGRLHPARLADPGTAGRRSTSSASRR
jgi:DNA helicase HerA-like ATPase